MIRVSLLTGVAVATLALSGCDKKTEQTELDRIDAKLGGKTGADPALSAALEDQIMVDPNLKDQANEDSIRPTNEPFQAPMPVQSDAQEAASSRPTLGSLATQQAALNKDRFKGCSLDVQYSMTFANRLPPELPLYNRARIAEAAGSDTSACRLRALTFTVDAAPDAVTNYYKTIAERAGFAVSAANEGDEMLVSGLRARDGFAFYVISQRAGSGTTVDLVTNHGQ